jgi:hypothetical protein
MVLVFLKTTSQRSPRFTNINGSIMLTFSWKRICRNRELEKMTSDLGRHNEHLNRRQAERAPANLLEQRAKSEADRREVDATPECVLADLSYEIGYIERLDGGLVEGVCPMTETMVPANTIKRSCWQEKNADALRSGGDGDGCHIM